MFEVDDLEQPWTFSKKFNYIHTEAMIGREPATVRRPSRHKAYKRN